MLFFLYLRYDPGEPGFAISFDKKRLVLSLMKKTTNFLNYRDKRYKRSCSAYIVFLYIRSAWDGCLFLCGFLGRYLSSDKRATSTLSFCLLVASRELGADICKM